jgi:hypothetical protein
MADWVIPDTPEALVSVQAMGYAVEVHGLALSCFNGIHGEAQDFAHLLPQSRVANAKTRLATGSCGNQLVLICVFVRIS